MRNDIVKASHEVSRHLIDSMHEDWQYDQMRQSYRMDMWRELCDYEQAIVDQNNELRARVEELEETLASLMHTVLSD